jgi:hypothetical protein
VLNSESETLSLTGVTMTAARAAKAAAPGPGRPRQQPWGGTDFFLSSNLVAMLPRASGTILLMERTLHVPSHLCTCRLQGTKQAEKHTQDGKIH